MKLQPGEGVKLHPGTWHAGPYFSNSTGLFFNLELRMTNKNDHNARHGATRALALTERTQGMATTPDQLWSTSGALGRGRDRRGGSSSDADHQPAKRMTPLSSISRLLSIR